MDEKLFLVETGDENGNSTELFLPATEYELLDVQDRLRMTEGEELQAEILECGDFALLMRLQGLYSLNSLNALSKMLINLDERGAEAFQGLVLMEYAKCNTYKDIAAERLIELASNTDCCHVLPGIRDDEQLGHFYVEYGFLSDMDGLSDEVLQYLDWARIGREQREAEGGVFTEEGYVVQDGEIEPLDEKMDFTPHKPEYVFRLALQRAEEMKPIFVELPMEDNELRLTLKEHGMPDAILSCDGPLPQLDAKRELEDGLQTLNTLAWKIQELDTLQMQKLKALQHVLKLVEPVDLLQIADRMEDYLVEPSIKNLEDYGQSELQFYLGKEEMERLLPYVNLRGYGKAAMEHLHDQLTPYGTIQRQDGEPIVSMEQELQRGGGMTLT